MTLPRQSALLSARNNQIMQEEAQAKETRKKNDPRYIQLNKLIAEEQKTRETYDKLYNETGKSVYLEKSDAARRRYQEEIRTVQRAIDKNISVSDQRRNEKSKRSNQTATFAYKAQEKEQEKVLTDKFGKEVVANMSPEAKATAYEQLTNKEFVATPNTAKAKDDYNRRQEANTQAQNRISAGGFTTAGEYFNSFSPKDAGVTVNANSYTPVRNAVTPRASLSPTLELAPNTSTESGAVYTAPNYQEPNTSTERGAIYSPPTSRRQSEGFIKDTKKYFVPASKEVAKEFWRGFTFADGVKTGKVTEISPQQLVYQYGQLGNIIPAGAAIKGLQLLSKANKAVKATKAYQGLSTPKKVIGNVGAFVATQGVVIGTGSQVARFYETQQLKQNLQGYNITPEEFRVSMSNAIVSSRKEGRFNAFKYEVSTRFGDDPAVYQETLTNDLRGKGFNDNEIKYLVGVANNTRGTREIIEAGTLVASAGTTEIFGRAAFSATNTYVNKIFTKKILREGTFKVGGTFTKTPLAYEPYKPALSSARALGVTATTKGGVLSIGGFTEGASQELLTQNVRQEERNYTAIAKRGYEGSVVAPALGVPIARGFETSNLGTAKGINMFANTVDVFEYAGDKFADGVTTLGKINYDVPTVTIGGSGKTPTYAYGSTNVQTEVSNNYFLTANKGQDTFSTRSTTNFNLGQTTPNVEKPKAVGSKVVTPSPALFPSQTKQDLSQFTSTPVPIPEPNPIPSASRSSFPNTVPLPISNTVPTTNPVPIPTTIPVSVPIPVTNTNTTVTIPIPVVTATPEGLGFAVGGAFGSGGSYGGGKKKLLKYTPSAFSLITGFKSSKPSKAAVKTGFSIRPISATPTRKGKKKKSNDEILSLLGTTTNGRKRKYKRLASF